MHPHNSNPHYSRVKCKCKHKKIWDHSIYQFLHSSMKKNKHINHPITIIFLTMVGKKDMNLLIHLVTALYWIPYGRFPIFPVPTEAPNLTFAHVPQMASDSNLLHVCMLNCFSWTLCDPAAWQAPLSMGFSRQEYWSGLHALLQELFPMSTFLQIEMLV